MIVLKLKRTLLNNILHPNIQFQEEASVEQQHKQSLEQDQSQMQATKRKRK